ncbi:MAG: isoprenylcysteine carboxylmethyltransferase family protein [Symploca sp. SIO2E6]|nr:isoprenylcysteine carboxylmethyltransferase family protein [Symploca sp. SIO2E6]
MSTPSDSTQQLPQASSFQRTTVLLYGIIVYLLGIMTILWLIACNGGLLPLGTSKINTNSVVLAFLINLMLVTLFGLQHSIMARSSFKEWWTQKIPAAAERSTYVLATALALGAILWFWQPMPMKIWSVEDQLSRYFIWGLFSLGWLYLVLATFATNHFDLFGLRQAYLYWREQPYKALPFMKKWMYQFNRHPIQTGILLGIWATPYMKLDHLVLSVTFTVYILIGLAFEERDLIAKFGEQYQSYRAEVGGIIPWKWGK